MESTLIINDEGIHISIFAKYIALTRKYQSLYCKKYNRYFKKGIIDISAKYTQNDFYMDNAFYKIVSCLKIAW